MFHFLQKKLLKKIRNKGTINVLQGGGGSAEYGQRPYFYKKKNLDPSLIDNTFVSQQLFLMHFT